MAKRWSDVTPWRLFSALLAIAVCLPAAGMLWAATLAHRAVASRVLAGNAATATALADQVSRGYKDRVSGAGNLLALISNGAHFGVGLNDATRLHDPFCNVAFLRADGTPVATMPLAMCTRTPVSSAALATDASPVTVPATFTGSTAVGTLLVALNPVERRHSPAGARWLEAQFPVNALFTPVQVGTTGQYAVVERQTSLVVAARTSEIVGQHLSAAAGRRLVTKDQPGVAQAFIPNLHMTILMAYQPIAGTPYGVFVALPTKEAFAQANHVRDVLLIGLAVLAAAGAVIAGWTARGVGRRNRQLMHSVDDLQRKATRDSLTGVANRREVSESLALFLAATARGDLDTVGVAFIDLDGFKDLNDRSGHVAADQLLRAIAGAMLGTLRPSDVLGRFGGDEFVVVAPGLGSPRAAAALGDRLRHAVATTAVISESDEFVGPVTASVGVAIGSGAMTVEELMGAADSAMYQAKAAGGNRAYTASDSAGLGASS